jgi:hypothetical protein
MNFLKSYPVKILAVGFIVLSLLSVPLFWARFYCESALVEIIPDEAETVRIEPSGLIPEGIENGPDVANHSQVNAFMRRRREPPVLGIVHYGQAHEPGGSRSNVYQYDWDELRKTLLYFDEGKGLIVYEYIRKERKGGLIPSSKQVRLYAGPDGVSENPDKALGRFAEPIVSGDWYYVPGRHSLWPLFDKKLRRFFVINFDDRTVVKGPEIERGGPHNPLQIHTLTKNQLLLHLHCQPPMKRVLKPVKDDEDLEERTEPKYVSKSIIESFSNSLSGRYILVLDESGRIDLLDRETLQFARPAGYLPLPHRYFPEGDARPKDLLAYRVQPVAFGPDLEYKGLCVATLSREGTALGLAVFDHAGRIVADDQSKTTEYGHGQPIHRLSAQAVYSDQPWAPALTISKYLLENLHPPILSVLSYFAAGSIEAAAGHRALFILPNSFVAIKSQQGRDYPLDIFIDVLGLLLLSIVLSALLAWRVYRDAIAIGLSENARLVWLIVTVAFGLSAYITYRLTRPRMTMVTCANCGRLRRPDMETCHRCGSKWHVPELTPPAWRVVNGQA